MHKVIKRDGTKVSFDVNKIIEAIIKSMYDVKQIDDGWAVNTALEIQQQITEDVTVKDIHTYVENALMKAHPNVARAYIDFRSRRDKAREEDSSLHQQIMGLINRTNSEVLNENSNKDSRVLHTQRDLLAGLVCKHYGLNHVLPKHVAAAHIDGLIHYHDLDYSPFFPITNCCLVDLEFMLNSGFKMGAAEIETPNSITTATAITAQIIAQVASSQYGGTTIGDIDVVLARYVKKTYDKHFATGLEYNIGNGEPEDYAMVMTDRDVESAMQGLLYEVNTLHTSNGQSPFVTFGFGLGDTWESRLIQHHMLTQQMNGLGAKKITPVFPKLVYALKDGHNKVEGDPFYDIKQLAVECTAKRMYPDFLSFENNTSITGSDKITYPMGCRSFLGAWKDPETDEFVTHGRNNLGVVSLNLPRIALDGGMEGFTTRLDDALALCKDALMERIRSLEGVTASVAPILYMEGAFGVKMKADDLILDLFKNGRASISLGYIGCHEMVNCLFPEDDHTYDSGKKQAYIKMIITYLKSVVAKWKEETGYAFSLYSTPSESLCDRFCKIDEKKFGVVPGVTDKGYYTNSFHLDVFKKVTPFEKFDFEKDYQWLATGGHISYAEYPDMKGNLKALEACVDYGLSKMSYIGTNTPVDNCFECGFDGEFIATTEGYHCPNCSNTNPSTISVIRRTCGYLGSVGSIPYNHGKQQEIIGRVKHV